MPATFKICRCCQTKVPALKRICPVCRVPAIWDAPTAVQIAEVAERIAAREALIQELLAA